MEAKKFVEKDLKEYSSQFNSLYTLRRDYTYKDTIGMLEAVDDQVKISLQIIQN